jgi:formate hydrogenlyase transcriptional activator
MSSPGLGSEARGWLDQNGPRELELLFRTIVYHPSAPILVTDNDGNSHDASIGVRRLFGLPREQIVGRRVEEFADPVFKPQISELWRALQDSGEQAGTFRLLGSDGSPRDVEYTVRGNVLPVRHVVVLRDRQAAGEAPAEPVGSIPSWVQDYALYLLDAGGCIAAWYSGAVRIYGYEAAEAIGQNLALLYPADVALPDQLSEECRRAAAAGHVGTEGWQARKDGSRFWANAITMALKDESGHLQGFARVVRDFSQRHEQDEQLRRTRARIRPIPAESSIAGIASGVFDRVPEVNDALLQLTGYRREDLADGRFHWPDLTPPVYGSLDELAHEEGLRFGACTPYEKELIRKDGSRVPVLVVTAVLQIAPFRWITFVQDLRERDRFERIEDPPFELKEVFEEIVGCSTALRRVQQQVEVVAPTDATVLILGETGTGKELVARAIHRTSPRANLPFITLNCAAIPTGLLESELFGYERGAFTGALSQKIGRFEMAHRGTLFLDEVGDIPLDLQPKLLRALQEKAFERLGGVKTIPIDVRLVAATNRNLAQMMGDKLFRSDLYYRLRVFPITTPPLRDRPEDIPVLARHFVKKYAAKMGRQIDRIPTETINALKSWSWPGNVRELENFIERSVILSSGSSLRAPLAELRADSASFAGDTTIEHMEREHILRVMRECGGVVTTAALRLGIPRTTLNAMMRKLGISRRDT